MTTVNLARRALFRQSERLSQPLRPPWGQAEHLFTDLCTRCSDCLDACPTGLIKIGSGGFPEVDFSAAECTFCGDCVDACQTDALSRQEDQQAWDYRAEVQEDSCLSLQGVFCRSCSDPCDSRAITFRLHVGGKAQPEIDLQACTGCGACVAPCPASAIVIKPEDALNE
ncbi:ferredoxin-type protein NapF [Corallincola spongiicola]|uniref:Ferredoxin-type protein NapF n=1 Tax=Corallincola spongiicola TaxID=2520508 RepID=A0ABY1WR40_9GAMM|nr:ferredoxin-type protein NapF [Corallincola spongiicola]TAA47184.1 ferredoxin-type protein NapF [Corallincola spongiicola]